MNNLDTLDSLRHQLGMLSPATSTKMVGQLIHTPPSELAASVNTGLDTYSLARCIASEGWGGLREQVTLAMVAMGFTVVNEAHRRDITITQLVTTKGGQYGEQNKVGYASTARDPTHWHIVVATMVIDGTVDNPIDGATKFVDPAVWATGGMQAGKRLRPFNEVMAEWHDEVAWIGPIPGIDSFHLSFFRREKNVTVRWQAQRDILKMYATRSSNGKPGGGGSGGGRSSPVGPFLVAIAFAGYGAWLLSRSKSWA